MNIRIFIAFSTTIIFASCNLDTSVDTNSSFTKLLGSFHRLKIAKTIDDNFILLSYNTIYKLSSTGNLLFEFPTDFSDNSPFHFDLVTTKDYIYAILAESSYDFENDNYHNYIKIFKLDNPSGTLNDFNFITIPINARIHIDDGINSLSSVPSNDPSTKISTDNIEEINFIIRTINDDQIKYQEINGQYIVRINLNNLALSGLLNVQDEEDYVVTDYTQYLNGDFVIFYTNVYLRESKVKVLTNNGTELFSQNLRGYRLNSAPAFYNPQIVDGKLFALLNHEGNMRCQNCYSNNSVAIFSENWEYEIVSSEANYYKIINNKLFVGNDWGRFSYYELMSLQNSHHFVIPKFFGYGRIEELFEAENDTYIIFYKVNWFSQSYFLIRVNPFNELPNN